MAAPLPARAVRPPSHSMPGLDVARGVAILMVLVDHGLAVDQTVYASGSHAMLALGHGLRLGHLGVHLFFILSGLLITTILLDHRTDRDYFRNFYTRRALRILPPYLLLLAVLYVTHSVTLRYVGVCVIFLANMTGLFGVNNQYGALWSLSVEEQFYLVWPVTVRRLSERGLAILCAGIVLLTPVLRFALLHGPHAVRDIRYKTWAVGDFFAAGALIALAWRSPLLRKTLRKAALPLVLGGAILAYLQHAAANAAGTTTSGLLHAFYLEPWLLLLSGFALFALVHPEIARLSAARPLLFLAKISYGLYLCHPFLFGVVARYWPAGLTRKASPVENMLLHFAAGISLSIAVATLSRFTLERFFLRRKPEHSPPSPARLL